MRAYGADLGDTRDRTEWRSPMPLVAAAASTAGLRLWTRHRRHYPMRDLLFHEPGADRPT